MNLEKSLALFSKARVLCVGDLILDRYVYGHVTRISPESPIPILQVDREFYTLGGVSNVANNVVSLGAHVHMIAVIGKDYNADVLKNLCREKGIDTDDLVESPNFPTILKNRYCAAQQQLLRVDYERIIQFDPDLYKTIIQHAEKLMPQVDVLVLSDYGKGVLNPDHVIQPLIKLAKKGHLPIIVDPKGMDFSLYRGATIITPNRKELQEATQLPTQTNKEVEVASRWIIDQCEIGNVVATRSEEGMTLTSQGKASIHLPTQAREVFDVSGAGDTVVATLAVGVAVNLPLENVVEISNRAGSVVVGKVGTSTVTPEEILESVSPNLVASHKIVSLHQAIDMVRKWRGQGYSIGFTNGCFDLLHKGHITLLRESRQQCDRLIVGLNTDGSVKGLKGPKRPIKSQDERALILASLQDVDLVILFSEETPLELIQALEPDVLIKGSDYRVDKVVGGSFVQNRGGRVVLVNLVDGFSTTGTINSLSES